MHEGVVHGDQWNLGYPHEHVSPFSHTFHSQAGLNISGINSEVLPGQWEYQIGPVGPLQLGDEVHLSRWLLHR